MTIAGFARVWRASLGKTLKAGSTMCLREGTTVVASLTMMTTVAPTSPYLHRLAENIPGVAFPTA